MLSCFTVSNYKSFNSLQRISLEAGKIRFHTDRLYTGCGTKLLKFLAIYGANASGKSSLVDAMGFAQEVIVNGIPRGYNDVYCRSDIANKHKPSSFIFEMTVGDKRYEYGFELLISAGEFVSEWLSEVLKSDARKIIFRRDISAGQYNVSTYFKKSDVVSRLKIYAEDIAADKSTLLLYQMNQNKAGLYSSFPDLIIYRKIYNWIKYNLSVNNPDRPVTNYPYMTSEDNVQKISQLLERFGTGITEFRVVIVPTEKVTARIPKDLYEHILEQLNGDNSDIDHAEKRDTPAILLRASDNSMFIIQNENNDIVCKTMEFFHKNSSSSFSLPDESDGTIRLLDLIEVLLCDEPGKVYVVDEINRRFHPLLTKFFISEYLEQAKNKDIQLIVTTHESELMSFDLLRKDEIAFINKNDCGVSSFYSMELFDARFDKKIRNAYMHGDYGAVPSFVLQREDNE